MPTKPLLVTKVFIMVPNPIQFFYWNGMVLIRYQYNKCVPKLKTPKRLKNVGLEDHPLDMRGVGLTAGASK